TPTRQKGGRIVIRNAGSSVHSLLLASAVVLLGVVDATAQPPVVGGPLPAAAQVHVDSARALAGDDLVTTYDFFCVPGNARPNNFSAPPLEPVKLFDNLYAVGNSESVVYAITTS